MSTHNYKLAATSAMYRKLHALGSHWIQGYCMEMFRRDVDRLLETACSHTSTEFGSGCMIVTNVWIVGMPGQLTGCELSRETTMDAEGISTTVWHVQGYYGKTPADMGFSQVRRTHGA